MHNATISRLLSLHVQIRVLILLLAVSSAVAGPFDSLKTNAVAKAAAAAAPTYSATFLWDPSPTPGVTNYTLFYGGASGMYTNSITCGLRTSNTVATFKGSVKYFAAVRCEAGGTNSPFSNEISFTLPLPQPYTNVITIAIEARDVTNPAAPFITVWSVNLTNPPGAGRFFRMKQP